jgi:hypothetical protein
MAVAALIDVQQTRKHAAWAAFPKAWRRLHNHSRTLGGHG